MGLDPRIFERESAFIEMAAEALQDHPITSRREARDYAMFLIGGLAAEAELPPESLRKNFYSTKI